MSEAYPSMVPGESPNGYAKKKPAINDWPTHELMSITPGHCSGSFYIR